MLISQMRGNHTFYLFSNHGQNVRFKVSTAQYFPPLTIDKLTVFIDDIVILHQMLACIKMVALNPPLNISNSLIDQSILNRGILIHSSPLHKSFNTVAAKAAEDFIL